MTAYSDTAYVAWGVDEESDELRYWIAVWDDDGPQSPETFENSPLAAKTSAESLAAFLNLEAVEVDEFGAVAQQQHPALLLPGTPMRDGKYAPDLEPDVDPA